ncbi:MAG: transcription termination/antitermination NusG family protein, partial [Thermodesulfobacteriota bacterium]|nr:transcription termination/antitermination NusG family protein [Thermodesulfobacteriota bacterium]MDY6857505.1 transcription termination/antitermination NusG family protein [Thermodesulfobacteriota bacterium]
MKNWYVANTKPREEERALFFLKDTHIDAYLPKMEACLMKRGKKVFVKKPLFPGYLFVYFNVREDLCKVRWA